MVTPDLRLTSLWTGSMMLAMKARHGGLSTRRHKHDKNTHTWTPTRDIPSSSSFSSLLESRLSRRSCLSISALIRLDSFASSLRQQAIMDSSVILPWCRRPPVPTGPEQTLQLRGVSLSPVPGSVRAAVGSVGWTRLGEGRRARGLAVKLCPQPSGATLHPDVHRKSRHVHPRV